jgi:hypothetical protein
VKFVGVGTLHAAFLMESRTRGRWMGQRTENSGCPCAFRSSAKAVS